MPKPRKPGKSKKLLNVADFCGEGEPYTEVTVKISIRVLGAGITRSRLAVNVVPDPALERIARKSLEELGKELFGLDENGNFGACLSDNFNGWEDLNDDYPRIDEQKKNRVDRECLAAMNAYIKESVDWALLLNKLGMEEAARNAPPPKPCTHVM